MLGDLKREIKRQEVNGYILEEASKRGVQDDVRDVFLDDVNVIVDGSENDPEMAKIVSKLPAYKGDDISDEAIEDLLAECSYANIDPYMNMNYTGDYVKDKELKNKEFTEDDKIDHNIETTFNNEDDDELEDE